jgi:hypothetical protein
MDKEVRGKAGENGIELTRTLSLPLSSALENMQCLFIPAATELTFAEDVC